MGGVVGSGVGNVTTGAGGIGPADGNVTPGPVGGANGFTSGVGSVTPGGGAGSLDGDLAGGDGIVTAGPDGGGAGLCPCPQTNIADPAIPNPISARPATRVILFIDFLPTPKVRAVLALSPLADWPGASFAKTRLGRGP